MGNASSAPDARERGGTATLGSSRSSSNSRASSPVRTCRVQHIEVISPGWGNGHALPPLPQHHGGRSVTWTRSRAPSEDPFFSKPRLPLELRRQIYGAAVATLLLSEGGACEHDPANAANGRAERAGNILELALVERAARAEVLSALFGELTLSGSGQLHSLTRLLVQNHRVARATHQTPLVELSRSRVRTLRLLQDRAPFCGEAREETARGGLYDSAARTRAYSKALLSHMTLLQLFVASGSGSGGEVAGVEAHTGIERLVLQAAPMLLCDVNQHDESRERMRAKSRLRAQLRANLTELVCMLSLWGNADEYEGLWELASAPQPPLGAELAPPAWSRLTHLQLHGPRMRFAASSARALGHLPALTHLAIVLPRFWPLDGVLSSEDAAALTAEAARGDQSGWQPQPIKDAAGRWTVLQVLIHACARLRELQLIGHDEPEYSGHVRALSGHAAAARLAAPAEANAIYARDAQPARDLQVHIVVLRRSQQASAAAAPARTHPTYYSHYLYALACRNRHWALPHRARSGSGAGAGAADEQHADDSDAQVDREWGVAASVESFDVPTVAPEPDLPLWRANVMSSSPGAALADDDAMEVDVE